MADDTRGTTRKASFDAPASKGSEDGAGKSWFLGVGIDRYLEFPDLHNAVKDVKDVIGVLIERYGFNQDHVVTLFDEQANEENLIDALDRLTEVVDEDDRLLIYFSGHGHLNKKTEMGFWIPHDAKKDRTARYIRNSTIRDYLKAIDSRHTLLISDACFSGSLFARGASRSTAAAEELETIPSRWAICSGRHDEEVYDGEPGQNSPFASSILHVLGTNQSDKLTVSRLADRVVEQTRSNYKQLPEGSPLYAVGHKGGQFVFHVKAEEDQVWADAERADSLVSFSRYLQRFSDGKYADQALARIRELEESSAWKSASRANSISALYGYLKRYPDGEYVAQANESLRAIEAGLADSNGDTRRPAANKPERVIEKKKDPPPKRTVEPAPNPPRKRPWKLIAAVSAIAILALAAVFSYFFVNSPSTTGDAVEAVAVQEMSEEAARAVRDAVERAERQASTGAAAQSDYRIVFLNKGDSTNARELMRAENYQNVNIGIQKVGIGIYRQDDIKQVAFYINDPDLKRPVTALRAPPFILGWQFLSRVGAGTHDLTAVALIGDDRITMTSRYWVGKDGTFRRLE